MMTATPRCAAAAREVLWLLLSLHEYIRVLCSPAGHTPPWLLSSAAVCWHQVTEVEEFDTCLPSQHLQVWFEVSAHTGRVHFHGASDGSAPAGLSLPMELLQVRGIYPYKIAMSPCSVQRSATMLGAHALLHSDAFTLVHLHASFDSWQHKHMQSGSAAC